MIIHPGFEFDYITKSYFYRYEEIWNAINENDTVKLEKWLKDKEWPASALFDKDKTNTMIHTAAGLGHVESLMMIIEHTDAKPDLLNANLASPLHFACRNNHEMVAKFLIGWGVDVNIQDEHGQTPLLICWIHGHRRLAQLLIDSSIAGHTPEPLDVDLMDNRGLTPLNWVAIKGNLDFWKLLLEKGGAKIDEPSPKGCTALLYAARGGFVDIVRYLLEKGSNSLHQDNSGETVAHHAIEKGKLEILEMLVKCSVDVDIADNAGRTPLFEAIENGNVTVSKILINNGVRLNITDYSGHSSLYCASRDGNEEIVKLLVKESKIKIDHFGKSSNTKEFDEDMQYENEEEKQLMEGLEASKTPLHVAWILGLKSIVSHLIEYGHANPNILGDKGYNSLHFAILGWQPEIVKYLLTSSSVDYKAKDSNGNTFDDLVKKFMPEYFSQYKKLISSFHSNNGQGSLDIDVAAVVTNYYTPEDDRALTGVQHNGDINRIYQEAKADALDENNEKSNKLYDVDESEIKIEKGKEADPVIERVFGTKTALGLISTNWKFREEALKYILKTVPQQIESDSELVDAIKGWWAAWNITIQDKVMKVFNTWIAIFSFCVSSSKLEEKGIDIFVRLVTDYDLINKLLERSEESNARISSKAQETLIDFSFHPIIGEGFVSTYLISRLDEHQNENNPKGIYEMLNLLHKFIISFGISKSDSPLSPKTLLKVVIQPLFHKDQEIRNVALKVLTEIQRKTGCIDESIFKEDSIPSGAQNLVDNIIK